MTAPITVSSQTTSNIIITSEQLRTTNLIFAEHEKLSKEVPLLKLQIANLDYINQSWQHTDSIRCSHIDVYQKQLADQNRSIEGLQKSLTKKRRIIKYGSIGSGILVALCLLLK